MSNKDMETLSDLFNKNQSGGKKKRASSKAKRSKKSKQSGGKAKRRAASKKTKSRSRSRKSKQSGGKAKRRAASKKTKSSKSRSKSRKSKQAGGKAKKRSSSSKKGSRKSKSRSSKQRGGDKKKAPAGLEAHQKLVAYIKNDMDLKVGLGLLQKFVGEYKDRARKENPNADSIQIAKDAMELYKKDKERGANKTLFAKIEKDYVPTKRKSKKQKNVTVDNTSSEE